MSNDCVSRRTFLKTSAAAAGVLVLGDRVSRANELAPVTIGKKAQLFLDEWIIAEKKGLKRTLHQPAKKGLIREADGRSWERGDKISVVRDASGRFHMTYRFLWEDPSVRDLHHGIGNDKAHWFRRTVGYAISDDGVHWAKPVLGLIDAPTGFRRAAKEKWKDGVFQEPSGFSKENNLGCPITMIQDLGSFHGVGNPKRRFLVNVIYRDDTHNFARITDAGLYFASEIPDILGDPEWRTHMQRVWEAPRRGPRGEMTHVSGYEASQKLWFVCSQGALGRWRGRGGRQISRYLSEDLMHWTPEEVVLPVADDESRDPADYIEYMDIGVHQVGDVWLGQLVIFHSDRTSPQYEMPTIKDVWRKGTTDVRLVVSRDAGKSWQRVEGKQTWIPHHTEEDGYDRLVFPGVPVRVDDEMWIYYPAWDGDHLNWNRDGTTYYKNRTRIGRTALATLRWDGYLSLDAAAGGGSLVTRPLRFQGDRLTVNLAAPKGRLKAELQDASGQPIPGFTLAESVPLQDDGVGLPMRWRDKAGIATLAGRPVRIHFDLTEGALYSYRFS